MASDSLNNSRKGALRLPARPQPTPRTPTSKGLLETSVEDPTASAEYLKGLIQTISDFPKPGIEFRDITPLLATPQAMNLITSIFSQNVLGVTAIAGIESRGFLFGVPVAQHLQLPFIPLRKPCKLPGATFQERYSLEYGNAELQLHRDALNSGDRVLLIDDLLATGGTAAAAIRLIQQSGAEVDCLAVVVELNYLNGCKQVGTTRLKSIVTYD